MCNNALSIFYSSVNYNNQNNRAGTVRGGGMCSSSQGWEKGQYRVGVGRGQVSVQQNDLCEFRVTFAQGVPPGVGGLAWGGVGLGVIVICWKEILTIYFNRNNTQCRTITGVILRSPVQPSP